MWENLEHAFRELEDKEFKYFAIALARYRDSLIAEGFTRREALRLVEGYGKLIYDLSLEEFIRSETESDADDDSPEFDDDEEI